MLAPMITYDGDVQATIGCLNAYEKTWPDCPFLFVVPINDARTQRAIETAVRGLHIAFVTCERAVSSTLDALLRFCAGGGDWLYLCNSDRYPLAFPNLEALSLLTEHLAARSPAAGVPPTVNAVKLFRWRETIPMESQRCSLCGHDFDVVDTQGNGFYHHHFIRPSLLTSLINGRQDFTNIYSFHDHLLGHPEVWSGKTLLPDAPIAKYGEITVGGKFTLNFAASIAPERSATLEVESWTKVFTSSKAPAANRFWLDERIAAQDVLQERTPLASTIVASFSPHCLDAIEANDQDGDLRATDRRFPFPDLSPGQQAFYLFEDPRETLLAVFDAVRNGGRPIASYLKRAQVSAPSLEPDADLRTYLDVGQDLLRLEEHFDFWLFGTRAYEVAFVRRATLAAQKTADSATSGLKQLAGRMAPPSAFYERADVELRQRIDEIYAPFAQRLAKLPDVFTA